LGSSDVLRIGTSGPAGDGAQVNIAASTRSTSTIESADRPARRAAARMASGPVTSNATSHARRGSAQTAPTPRAAFGCGPPSASDPQRRWPPRRSRGEHPALSLSPRPPCRSSTRGEPVGKRHRRIRARSATGQVAGAATEQPGLKAHRRKTACPACVPPKAPSPRQPNLSQPPDVTRGLREAVSCPEWRKRLAERGP
jgi:hypothetical protein